MRKALTRCLPPDWGRKRAGHASLPAVQQRQHHRRGLGRSSYHGVNFGAEKRYSNGLLFKANYTFAKFIDNLAARNELAAFPGTERSRTD